MEFSQVEKCKNTTESKSLQITHPGMLVGCYARAAKDYQIAEGVSLPIKGRKVLVVGCRIQTELPDFPLEVMFEVMDASFFEGEPHYLTISGVEAQEYLTDIHM